MPNALKTAVLLGVLAGHALLLYLLITMKPAKWVASANAAISGKPPEQVTVLEFITRPRKASINKAPESAPKNRAAASNGMQVEFSAKGPSAAVNETNVSTPDADVAPLILSLPEPDYDFSPPPRDLLAKQRNPLETQKTRFSNAWKPDGNAVDSLKWKSKTVNAVLGLFGGNMKICTDEDRRNLNPACVPDNYRPEQ
ncbi:MAG: hypothetical protein KA218_02405 [Arenimonas sp.]|nr:hypothetical protein [Arenimonas sp.]